MTLMWLTILPEILQVLLFILFLEIGHWYGKKWVDISSVFRKKGEYSNCKKKLGKPVSSNRRRQYIEELDPVYGIRY